MARDYLAYAVGLRRQIHQHPGIGYDLGFTLDLVKRELEDMGLSYTETYGKSSIVATLNPEKTGFTIGLRGDMDALPIQEQSDKPYRSQVPGVMHACGHDVHTANLLAVARELTDRKEEICCRVRFLFTPAEEYADPGCKRMVEDGVMDDIDICLAGHVSPHADTGSVLLTQVSPGANSMGFTAEFFGTSAHAARQTQGRDAIRMAVEAYEAMEIMVAKEVDANQPRLLNVGAIHGGATNNIICDYCKMICTCRAHDDDTSAYMRRRIYEICEGVAAIHGGSAKVTIDKFLPYVKNDPTLLASFRKTAEKVVGEDHIIAQQRTMEGEDFGFLSRKKPCCFFHLGTRNPADPNTGAALHSVSFDVDEAAMDPMRRLMVQFVLDHMDGTLQA